MPGINDLDHLCARLHGRSSLLPGGGRLRSFCGLASPAALAAALYPGGGIKTCRQLQARLAADHMAELAELAACSGKARAALMNWLAARLQAENLKLVIRALCAGADRAETARLIIALPGSMNAYGPELAAASDLPALAASLPPGPLSSGLESALGKYPEGPAFFYEAAVDRAYYTELAALSSAPGCREGGHAAGLAGQEIAAYNLALAARGRFVYGLAAGKILPFFAPGSGLSLIRFKAMLSAPGIKALRFLAAGLALDPGPDEADPAALEALCRKRYAALARRAWRGSHMGFGAVMGYAALRRIYTEDLSRICEGLRLGLRPEEIYVRLAACDGEDHVQPR